MADETEAGVRFAGPIADVLGGVRLFGGVAGDGGCVLAPVVVLREDLDLDDLLALAILRGEVDGGLEGGHVVVFVRFSAPAKIIFADVLVFLFSHPPDAPVRVLSVIVPLPVPSRPPRPRAALGFHRFCFHFRRCTITAFVDVETGLARPTPDMGPTVFTEF